MGRFLALLLAPHHNVTLYERSTLSDSKTTGRVAAAMVAPVAESVLASHQILTMGMSSCQLWQPLLSHLQLTTPFQQSGSLLLAHRQDLPELSHFQRRIKLPEYVESLSRGQLCELEPELESDFAAGLWLPTEGHIDNQLLYQELEDKIRLSEICLREESEVSVEKNTVTEAETTTRFDLVIDCRGLGGKTRLANCQKSLRGVRGEVVRVYAPEVQISRPVRLMHPKYPIYVVPKSNGQYVIGATEIESEDDKPFTVRSALELLSAAYSLHRGFAEAQILSLDVGLRPTLQDNEPAIVVDSDKSIQINGLYRHGYLLTPCILSMILTWLNQQGWRVPDIAALAEVELPEILSNHNECCSVHSHSEHVHSKRPGSDYSIWKFL